MTQRFGRRTLLKVGGGALIAAVAAPLFIPSDRLDFGVPRQISTDTLTARHIQELWHRSTERFEASRRAALTVSRDTLPMLLVHDEFMFERGGRLAAGTRLLVDQATSDRWIEYGVAVPDRGHPRYGQVLLKAKTDDRPAMGNLIAEFSRIKARYT